jgi:hypothetical protein
VVSQLVHARHVALGLASGLVLVLPEGRLGRAVLLLTCLPTLLLLGWRAYYLKLAFCLMMVESAWLSLFIGLLHLALPRPGAMELAFCGWLAGYHLVLHYNLAETR